MNKKEQKNISKLIDKADKKQRYMENNRQVVTNPKRIDFYGGEPWLIQEHWDTLSKMVELGYSKDCIIPHITNGTVFKKQTS